MADGKNADTTYSSHSHFIENRNGALFLDMTIYAVLNFNENVFLRNKGTLDLQGVALYIKANYSTTINLFYCYFDHNVASGEGSILYIIDKDLHSLLGCGVDVSMWSSKFVNNEFGSALHISQITVQFYNSTLFENNSAKSAWWCNLLGSKLSW